jgi:geranylgeranyl diphosphate synthase, type II
MLKLESDIENYLFATRNWINRQLDQLIPENGSSLISAARYSLFSGGKRIRPILSLAAAEVLQGDPELALNPACALEMVHTYSLIHDDLPSMDNDDFRRGKPTLHKVYPESHAILTGDFLLNFAFEVLAGSPGLTHKQKVELIKTLTLAGGAKGMIGGQIMDLESCGSLTCEQLLEIHQHKTSALLEAAFAFGAIIAKAGDKEREILQTFGRQIGLIFQIIDDILDMDSDNKTTYATLLGPDKAYALASGLHLSALENLAQLPYETKLLAALAGLLLHRKN